MCCEQRVDDTSVSVHEHAHHCTGRVLRIPHLANVEHWEVEGAIDVLQLSADHMDIQY